MNYDDIFNQFQNEGKEKEELIIYDNETCCDNCNHGHDEVGLIICHNCNKIIPKRHIKDFFDLTNDELTDCNLLIKSVKDEILHNDKSVEGFNLGTNIGEVSGQSILHCHFHLIPRRKNDVENPQGGVRSVIPDKQHYKRKK